MHILFMRKAPESGGPGTFQLNMTQLFLRNGHQVFIHPSRGRHDVVFVISGTRNIISLLLYKRRGALILQRLDGISICSDLNRYSIKTIFISVLRVLLMQLIRKYIADIVIYQSFYVKRIWECKFGHVKSQQAVILNAANRIFHRTEIVRESNSKLNIIIVEGTVQEDDFTCLMLSALDSLLGVSSVVSSVEVFGRFLNKKNGHYTNIKFKGTISRDEMPFIYRAGNPIFILLERNPPCPNSLIEALSAAVPVVGLDEGSFNEIVGGCGKTLSKHADSYTQEDLLSELLAITSDIFEKYDYYSRLAQERADRFSIEKMFDDYIFQIEKCIGA